MSSAEAIHHTTSHNSNNFHQLTTSSAISSSSTISSSSEDTAVAGPLQPLNKRGQQHDGLAQQQGSVTAASATSTSGYGGHTLSGVMSADRSAKVSRCFGNTNLCMPQTLLCFKVRLCTW